MKVLLNSFDRQFLDELVHVLQKQGITCEIRNKQLNQHIYLNFSEPEQFDLLVAESDLEKAMELAFKYGRS